MFGPFDIALIAGLVLMAGFGWSLGAIHALGSALALVAAVAAAAVTPLPVLAALAAFAVVILAGALAARRARTRKPSSSSRLVGAAVAIVPAAAIAVALAGALNVRLDDNSVVRTAWSYPGIQLIGERMMARGDLALAIAFPEPIADEPEDEAGDQTASARPVDWARVAPFDRGISRILTGSVVAADRAPLSFEVTGTLSSVNVEIGDRFSTDDVLAELEPTALRIALDERRAALIEAEARATEARLMLERQQELSASRVISEAALESAVAVSESAQSRLAMAEAGVRQAEDRLDDAVLRAPYEGIVAARLVEPAQTLQAGAPAFEIQNANAGFQIEITVPDALIAQIVPGSDHGAVILDGTATAVTARVHEIGSRANATTGFPVTLDILNADHGVRAGMTAEVHLDLRSDPRTAGASDVLGIPYTAILPGDGDRHVAFVFQSDTQTLEKRRVTVAGREGTTALISEGLEDGDIVATRGLPFLHDGQRVALRGVGIVRYDD
ncbi:MAG: efflux RND transporter periplasmic adaptor subunit [Oricola sp.]|nr:MAG: efflux RND transporter periplasmic adaptor subunit [Oricola sp.]